MYHEPDIVSTQERVRVKHGETWVNEVTVTHQAKCSCGWSGPKRNRRHEADDDCMEHRIAENEA